MLVYEPAATHDGALEAGRTRGRDGPDGASGSLADGTTDRHGDDGFFHETVAPSRMNVAEIIRLAGFALGALGSVLVFVEFFQMPTYVEYEPQFGTYSLDLSPGEELQEHSWVGRIGAMAVALAFALLFVSELLAA